MPSFEPLHLNISVFEVKILLSCELLVFAVVFSISDVVFFPIWEDFFYVNFGCLLFFFFFFEKRFKKNK